MELQTNSGPRTTCWQHCGKKWLLFILFIYVLFNGAVTSLLNKRESNLVPVRNKNGYVREEV